MIIGCQMCWGAVWGPVDTTLEAKKPTSDIDAVTPPTPTATMRSLINEKGPTAPPSANLMILIDPVILRISSRPQAPASRSLPSAQARKGRGQGEKPFIPMEFSKSLAPFRNWVLGQSQNAGMYKADVFKAHHHDTKWNPDRNPVRGSGGSVTSLPRNDAKYANDVVYGYNGDTVYSFMADSGGAETAPCHIYQPVILYLGRPR